MSHFTVGVRLPASLTLAQVEHALEQALIPYQEHACTGKCPEQYLEFHDTETEYLEQYETEGSDFVKMPDGRLLRPWDEEFRVPGGGLGIGSHTHKVPDGLEEVEIPHKQQYATFEIFMKEYASDPSRDEKTGRYGYWENPHHKWDYWRVGGRWRGMIPFKADMKLRDGIAAGPVWEDKYKNADDPDPDGLDIIRIDSIDMDKVAEIAREKVAEHWAKWSAWAARGYDDKTAKEFYGIRHTGLDYGLVECFDTDKDADEIAKRVAAGWAVRPWDRADMPNRVDVIAPVTEEAFKEKLRFAFVPIRTFAFLDATKPEISIADRWVAPGEMGWFGHSSADDDTRVEYGAKFMEWIKSGDPRDWFVIVDCHT